MELRKIIEISRLKIIETHNAFYAGHPEVAENYLVEAHDFLHKYFKLPSDVTDLADTETPLEGLRDQERVAQDSAGNEPMLNFTEHIKRIEYLADRTLVNVQAEKLDYARNNLIHISFHNNEALQKLNELIKLQQHIDDGSKKVEG